MEGRAGPAPGSGGVWGCAVTLNCRSPALPHPPGWAGGEEEGKVWLLGPETVLVTGQVAPHALVTCHRPRGGSYTAFTDDDLGIVFLFLETVFHLKAFVYLGAQIR